MANSLFWTTSVLIAVMAFNQHNCQNVHTNNKEANPQKLVEIIELMFSQKINSSDQKNFGIQKVPQGDSSNYEILITPNKNLHDAKGSQKIKIFVEATNSASGVKPIDESKIRSEQPVKREKHNTFERLPLSISTTNFNTNQYQQTGTPVAKVNNHHVNEEKEIESNPSKRQTSWGVTQKPKTAGKVEGKNVGRQLNNKEAVVQREPSYVDQNNPYQPVVTQKKEERPRENPPVNQNGQRISQIPYNEYVNPVIEPSRTQSRPLPPKGVYETVYEEPPFYVEVKKERRPSKPVYSREEEVYVPSESRNPVYNDEIEEERPSYGREQPRPSNVRPVYVEEPERERPAPERYPDYEDERPSNGRNPSYGREPEKSRPVRRPAFEKESSFNNYDERPGNNRRPADNSGYAGFPESYEHAVDHYYKRPLQYEARVFPASPCLNVFKYEGREPESDRWYGDIYVTTDEALNGMRLEIRLDGPAETLSNWMADVKTKDNIDFTLLSLNHRLVPGPPETVRIMVKFNDSKPVPYLQSIYLNGRKICPSSQGSRATTRRPVYENPGDLQTRRTTVNYQEVPKKPLNYNEDYESKTKRTAPYNDRTTPLYVENRKTTPRPSSGHVVRPNPNGYEETDQNSFSAATKPPAGRPSHSNGKPPPHAAKPAQGNKPGNQNQGQGQNFNNKNPSSGSNKPPPVQTSQQNTQKKIHCGTPSIQPSPLISYGQLTSRGQWPWHVALYKNVGTDLNFFCGGSLINSNHVLTAAHCVTKSYTTKPVDENSLVVYLGKYHLKLWSEGGVQNRQVSKIHVHPKYNNTDFRNDIAVLALSTPVEYSDYVRPICLWDRSKTKIEEVEGKEGTVVGWGFDENKMLTEELRQAKMPVVEQKTCLWSYPDFYPQFTSNMTYCAGFRNGTSVCNGDSGGGMVFRYKDKEGVERWHVRGIVSISPVRNDAKVCDTSHYVVFTDVAKFLPWLDKFL